MTNELEVLVRDGKIVDKVYVVVARSGEYEDEMTWIAAIYLSLEQAHTAVSVRWAKAREAKVAADVWYEKWLALRRARNLKTTPLGVHTGESEEIIKAEIGIQPPGPEADEFYVAEIPINVWGQYDKVSPPCGMSDKKQFSLTATAGDESVSYSAPSADELIELRRKMSSKLD
jgi:hypothetical protein